MWRVCLSLAGTARQSIWPGKSRRLFSALFSVLYCTTDWGKTAYYLLFTNILLTKINQSFTLVTIVLFSFSFFGIFLLVFRCFFPMITPITVKTLHLCGTQSSKALRQWASTVRFPNETYLNWPCLVHWLGSSWFEYLACKLEFIRIKNEKGAFPWSVDGDWDAYVILGIYGPRPLQVLGAPLALVTHYARSLIVSTSCSTDFCQVPNFMYFFRRKKVLVFLSINPVALSRRDSKA